MSMWKSLRPQKTGSVVCSSCGRLVGVQQESCPHCGRRNPGLWGYASVVRRLGQDLGFVPIVMVSCIVLFLLSLLTTVLWGQPVGGRNPLALLSPSRNSVFLFGATGAQPVFDYGRWWTLLSAGWLHGGLLHIAFNLYWVRQLGPMLADAFGPGRAVIIYTLSSVAGFGLTTFVAQYGYWLPSFLQGAPLTVGASAAVFGWLGALVYYGRRTGQTHLGQQLVMGFVVPMLLLGLLLRGFVGIDNWAHLGGFGGGYLTAKLFDPAQPERIDHLLGALLCLVASALAVLASVLLSFVRVST